MRGHNFATYTLNLYLSCTHFYKTLLIINAIRAFIWSLVIRHIPELKKDVEHIIDEYGISPEKFGHNG